MKMGYGGSVRRDLGRLFEGLSVAGLGEAQLLDRFIERRDSLAFEALVARHGPMVLGVCRRLLADPLDVEDAFQATFLILIRRAGSIRGRDRLAPWLFGVARKVASRTRTDLARRRAREFPGAEEIATVSGGYDREMNQALLEEIERLPESLREPILLCCVEGLSYDEAATRMESTAPAVRGRLSRGRERLRDRLTRRGFAPSAVVLGGRLAEGTASAAVPSKLLMMTTIQASKAGAFPASVEILAEGVIRTMIVTKSKFLAAALLACGVAGSGVGVYAQRTATRAPEPMPTASADVFAAVNDSEEAGPLPTAVAQSPDNDRLGLLEKKLDRVLEALEGNSGFRPAPRNPTIRRDGATATIIPDTPAAATRPATPDTPVPGAVPAPPVSRNPGAAFGQDGRKINRIDSRFAPVAEPARIQEDGTESRIDALERKLGRLEDRINNLERKLNTPNLPGAGQPSSDNPPTATSVPTTGSLGP